MEHPRKTAKCQAEIFLESTKWLSELDWDEGHAHEEHPHTVLQTRHTPPYAVYGYTLGGKFFKLDGLSCASASSLVSGLIFHVRNAMNGRTHKK